MRVYVPLFFLSFGLVLRCECKEREKEEIVYALFSFRCAADEI